MYIVGVPKLWNGEMKVIVGVSLKKIFTRWVIWPQLKTPRVAFSKRSRWSDICFGLRSGGRIRPSFWFGDFYGGFNEVYFNSHCKVNDMIIVSGMVVVFLKQRYTLVYYLRNVHRENRRRHFISLLLWYKVVVWQGHKWFGTRCVLVLIPIISISAKIELCSIQPWTFVF